MTVSFVKPVEDFTGLVSGQLRSRTTGTPVGVVDEIRFALTLLSKIHRLQMRKNILAGNVDLAELDEAQAAVYEDVLSDLQVALDRGGSEAAAAAEAVVRLRSVDARLAAAIDESSRG